MKIEEHLVARNLVEKEIRDMINDFRNGNSELLSSNWEEDGKNKDFADSFYERTGYELTKEIIKSEIISEITFDMFVDVIYPKPCDKEKDEIKKKQLCLDAIKNGKLYWVFNFKNFTTRSKNDMEVNFGNLYLKLNPIDETMYIVKSLHYPRDLDSDGKFTERDLSMVYLYDDYVNGKIE